MKTEKIESLIPYINVRFLDKKSRVLPLIYGIKNSLDLEQGEYKKDKTYATEDVDPPHRKIEPIIKSLRLLGYLLEAYTYLLQTWTGRHVKGFKNAVEILETLPLFPYQKDNILTLQKQREFIEKQMERTQIKHLDVNEYQDVLQEIEKKYIDYEKNASEYDIWADKTTLLLAQ
jgi:hypothetical protein